MKINDAIFGAVFALLGAIVLVDVQGFPKIPGQQYGPAIFPGLVATGLIVCGLLLVFYGARHRAEQPWVRGGDWLNSRRHVVAAAAIVLGVAAYIALAGWLGFLLVAPPLLLLWFRVLGVRWRTAAIAAAGTSLAIWYVFYKLLRVPLPWGVLTPWAF
ncbi:MAG: tripartite tricarboxylate transporter TctB family protein [Betaproteobacteria bacterium]|nr:tripartite tricarboxylate transporter TctB family protein [Betaproteobacteria bacterium]